MSNTIIQTNDGRYYKKPGFLATAAGVAAGSAAGSVVAFAQMPVSNRLMGKMSKTAQSADAAVIRSGLQEALTKSGLADKVKLTELNEKSVTFSPFDFIPDKLKKNKLFKSMFEQMDMAGAIKNGKNAAFDNITNKILINTEKMGAAGFHEVGHAINFNKSKFWKIMQIARTPLMALPSLFLTIALFKRKKAEGEKPNGFFDKVTTYIKNNVGKLSAAAWLPVVAEELMATKRGNALAKQILSPENFKKVAKVNKFGAITYIGGAALIGVTAYLCNKIRDAVASPKEIKA